jgi:RecA-family ATPase
MPTLEQGADEPGLTPPLEAYADEPELKAKAVNGSHDKAPLLTPPRALLEWDRLQSREVPAREWALEHWLPRHHASLLAGRGGIGKTLAAQHLGTAMALGKAWVDEIRKPLRVLLWAGEDDANELWRRQLGICEHFQSELKELQDLFCVQSYESVDITLAHQVYGLLQPTPMMAELTAQIRDYEIEYVFLDNIARIYGGNENDRHQVTQFLSWLTAACQPAGVCLLGHPSKGAGSEYSGSTAWEGAVRARLYLSDRLPDAPVDPDAPPDESVRYLSRRKSNYSPNDWRKLEMRSGVLIPETRDVAQAVRQVSGQFAQDIVLRAVRRLATMNIICNTSTRSPDYLPRLASQYGLLDSLAEKRFAAIMRECVKDGSLKIAAVGHYSNRTVKLGLTVAQVHE